MNELYVHLTRSDPVEMINMLKGTSFNIELNFDNRWLKHPLRWIDGLRKELKGFGGEVALHGPYMDLNGGSIEDRVRHLTMELFLESLEVCKALGVDSLVLHCGYIPPYYRHIYELWLKNSVETWRPVVEAAEESGVKIHIENSFEERPEPIIRLLEALDSDNIKVCFDVGHVNIFSRVSPERWIEKLSGWIAEIHLHDNDGCEDKHLPIGGGEIDYGVVLLKIREHKLRPRLTLEMRTVEDAYSSARNLKAMGWGDL